MLAELARPPELLESGGLEERVPVMVVEAVGIEPTSEDPQPQASTPIAG
jgi:hypothetical protein